MSIITKKNTAQTVLFIKLFPMAKMLLENKDFTVKSVRNSFFGKD
jgi:hypothetical protein